MDAVLRLLAGAIGEADDGEGRQISRDEVGLDLDATRLEPDDGGSESPGQHTSDGTDEPVPGLCQLCAETVPKPASDRG